jgi:hypothetical protein
MFYKSYRSKLNLIFALMCAFLTQLNAAHPPVPIHLMEDLDDPINGFVSSVDTWAKEKSIILDPLIQFARSRNVNIPPLIKQDLDFFTLAKNRVNRLSQSADPMKMKELLKRSYWSTFGFNAYTRKARFLSNIPKNKEEEYVSIIIKVLHTLANDAGVTQELIEKAFSCDEFTEMSHNVPDSLKILPENTLSLLEGIEDILPPKFKNKKSCSVM